MFLASSSEHSDESFTDQSYLDPYGSPGAFEFNNYAATAFAPGEARAAEEVSPDAISEEEPVALGKSYPGFFPVQPPPVQRMPEDPEYEDGIDNVLDQGAVVPVQPENASSLGGGYKDVKIKQDFSSPEQQRLSPPTKLDAIRGSLPYPPDLELPAILGGKLPPRTSRKKSRKHVYTERELRIRRKKGLPDDSDSESEERRLVRLPRRSLLTITTGQMAEFVKYMREQVELTPSQKDELSRQKRLVKNRESACRFRAKKVLSLIECCDRLEELENDVVTLRSENEKLRQQLFKLADSSGLPIPDVGFSP